MGKIHHFTVGRRELSLLASAAVLVGVAAYAQHSSNPNGPKMANVPGAVSASPAGSAMLTGHFEIRAVQPGERFIFSPIGMGGACLVTQYPAIPRSCTRHTECGLPPSGTGEGASSYCLPESPGKPTGGNAGEVPPNGAGTCWIKPSDKFCQFGAGVGQHDTPPADSAPVVAAARVKKWRVLTCLNGIPSSCAGAPATPDESLHEEGPVYTAP